MGSSEGLKMRTSQPRRWRMREASKAMSLEYELVGVSEGCNEKGMTGLTAFLNFRIKLGLSSVVVLELDCLLPLR